MRKQLEAFAFERVAFLSRLDPKKRNRTLLNLVSLLSSGKNKCKTVIEEKEYVDEDYRDEFSAFYSKSFKSHPHRCIRYHFFTVDFSTKEIQSIEQFHGDYIGFMVWRPNEIQAVGRTILSPKSICSNDSYIHCIANFKSHILGREFSVLASPFIQQDARVGACAHAALWMAARYMSGRFSDREFTPPQINILAKKNITLGRLYPADRGLMTNQILAALDGMGYSSEVYSAWDMPQNCADGIEKLLENAKSPKNGWGRKKKSGFTKTMKLAEIAYRYIESGLPVLFLTEDHAFVGIGHTLKDNANARVAMERIPSFITNNDNTGPYQQIPIWGIRNKKESKSQEIDVDTDYMFYDVDEIITIMPQEVALRGEEAENTSLNLVQEFIINQTELLGQVLSARADLGKWWKGKNILSRTFLIRTTEWLTCIFSKRESGELSQELCDELLSIDYPKYLWITELTSNAILGDPKAPNKKCLGYVISDSTAQPNTMCVIVAHILDILWVHPEAPMYFPGSTPLNPKVMARS